MRKKVHERRNQSTRGRDTVVHQSRDKSIWGEKVHKGREQYTLEEKVNYVQEKLVRLIRKKVHERRNQFTWGKYTVVHQSRDKEKKSISEVVIPSEEKKFDWKRDQSTWGEKASWGEISPPTRRESIRGEISLDEEKNVFERRDESTRE